MWQVGVPLEGAPPPQASPAPHPSLTPAGGLNLDTVFQFLRTLNVPPAALVELEKAVPPPVPKKTAHQQTEEQRCSQLRGKVDMTKQQLAKLSKRRETLAKEYMEGSAKVEEKTRELAQLEAELEEARRLIMQPTPPTTPPPSQAKCGNTSPRVSEVASSGMAVDAELFLPADGEEKGPKRLRVGTTGDEAPSLQQVLAAQDTFSTQDHASIIHSFQLRQVQVEEEELANEQRDMENGLGWCG